MRIEVLAHFGLVLLEKQEGTGINPSSKYKVLILSILCFFGILLFLLLGGIFFIFILNKLKNNVLQIFLGGILGGIVVKYETISLKKSPKKKYKKSLRYPHFYKKFFELQKKPFIKIEVKHKSLKTKQIAPPPPKFLQIYKT